MRPSILQFLGVVMLVIGGLLWFAMLVLRSDLGALGSAAIGLVGSGFAIGGQQLFNRARRLKLLAKGAVTPPAEGGVLYLRSFSEDAKTGAGVSSGVAFGGSGLITEEEQLVAALSSVGPTVAVGAPGEELPLLGANRVRFSHEEWQQGVQEPLATSRLVVLRAGSFSPGVRWEIQQVVAQVKPERFVLVIGGRAGKQQDADLARFTANVNPLLPQPLPASYLKRKLYTLGTIRAFVSFDQNWQPTLLPVAVNLVPVLKRTITRRLVPYYRSALRPVLTRLGFAPPSLPVSVGMVMMVGGLGLMALFFVVRLAAIFGR